MDVYTAYCDRCSIIVVVIISILGYDKIITNLYTTSRTHENNDKNNCRYFEETKMNFFMEDPNDNTTAEELEECFKYQEELKNEIKKKKAQVYENGMHD